MYRAGLSDPAHMTSGVVYFPSSFTVSSSCGLAMAMDMDTQAAFVATRNAAAPAPHSLPDRLRCGYTSKRCENPRTVKKSGGLHRFCAYHRERANKNQWRVDNRRRLLRKRSRSIKSASDCGSPRSTMSDSIEDAESAELLQNGDETDGNDHFSDLLDPAGSPDTLSDQDAKILNAMLFSDEDEPSTATTNQEPAEPVTKPARTYEATLSYGAVEPTCAALSVSMDAGSWNCTCSQCLAWPTVYYYHDALDAARQSRIQTYARV